MLPWKDFIKAPLSEGWSWANSTEKGKDGGWRGISEERKRTEWERKRASWHLRDHINFLNRCDIIIKLAVVSLFSCGPSLVLTLGTKPMAILQASFQMLREIMTGTKGLSEENPTQSHKNTHVYCSAFVCFFPPLDVLLKVILPCFLWLCHWMLIYMSRWNWVLL